MTSADSHHSQGSSPCQGTWAVCGTPQQRTAIHQRNTATIDPQQDPTRLHQASDRRMHVYQTVLSPVLVEDVAGSTPVTPRFPCDRYLRSTSVKPPALTGFYRHQQLSPLV